MKLLLIGPSKAGKSVLASFLAGMLDSTSPASEPSPTVGVRILEFTGAGVPVELWDVSGDQSYENTWPAVQQGADGIILCYCPESQGHAVSAEPSAKPLPALCQLSLFLTPGFCCENSPSPPPHTPYPLPCGCYFVSLLWALLQKELELFYEWFCVKKSFPPERCACFALSQSGAGGTGVAASAIGGVQPETFLLRADGGEGVKRAFERFVTRLRGVR
jgi:GTPase SAR1 family protein